MLTRMLRRWPHNRLLASAVFTAAALLGPLAGAQSPAASRQPNTSAEERAREAQLDELLGTLTLAEKAGQLFMCWSLSRPTQPPADGGAAPADGGQNPNVLGRNHAQLLEWVEQVGLGGVILSLGDVKDAARLVPELQRRAMQTRAKVPLLLASDFEGGVWFRLKGATELGNQMLVGATGSPELARRMGEVTGREAKALGFHWVFAPVLDVNSNPDNPIINVRSFGEDPELVATLGRAFARGVRSQGLIACGKHFPGHGDVSSDSHLKLATVPGDAERLRRVELHPFEVCARDGLESVMTGHLAVPGLGEDPGVPATLSQRILVDVLRKQLGFEGLVVTDALDMGGVKGAFPPAEVAIRALLAGADVLLMPPDPVAARDAVVAAVTSGRVAVARLDDAVRRILAMKQRVGLLDGRGRRGMVQADWQQQIGHEDSVALAADIAKRGIVLVRDRDGVIAAMQDKDGALLVTLLDSDEGQGEAFVAGMREKPAAGASREGNSLRLSKRSSKAEVAAAITRVEQASDVILAAYVRVRAYSGGIGLPANLQPLLAALRPEQRVVLVSFGNPYLVRGIDAADSYVAAFTHTEPVQRAVAAALRGQQRFVGRLPVGIPDVAAAGAGLSVTRRRAAGNAVDAVEVLPQEQPNKLGMAADLADQLRNRLQQAVEQRAFPGARCMVVRHGSEVANVSVGELSYDDGAAAVAPSTRYDMASLTKVCATTPAILRLAADGKLTLDDPVQKWLPAFSGAGKEAVTLRHLLAHQGGLPSYVRFFRTMAGKDKIVAAAAKEGLMLEPGTAVRYSDLGFILLMAVVEAASGEAFEDYVARTIWQPLGMQSASFYRTPKAGGGGPAPGAAPTELDPQRGGIVTGYVHDENAFAMGGISGHAGMFATARDLACYGRALLSGGGKALPRKLVEAATRPAGLSADTTRGLGFQLLQSGGYGGTAIPAGTFGHTGFTGTSLWCCPRHDICVVLLTNRVHPTRVNNKITAVRRAVHDLVLESLH
ncbi:MAG: glycoside hydrolase family 3 N-terminal domain-containing protein [Planctomycetota bacterium]